MAGKPPLEEENHQLASFTYALQKPPSVPILLLCFSKVNLRQGLVFGLDREIESVILVNYLHFAQSSPGFTLSHSLPFPLITLGIVIPTIFDF